MNEVARVVPDWMESPLEVDDRLAEQRPLTAIAPHALFRLQLTVGNAAMAALMRQATVADDAKKLVSSHTSWGNLEEEELGKELVSRLPAQSELVLKVFDTLGWSDRDDVAYAICEAADDDRIKAIARFSSGRQVMLRVVRELQAGYTTDAEAKQMQRVLNLLADVSTPHIAGASGETIEIKVITFRSGLKPLDWLGEHVAQHLPRWKGSFGKGAKGHTALVVGGLVYSFDEAGWEVGESEADYLAENTHRDAHIQVLDLPIEDAKKIQKHLNDAANKGVYFFGGEVCTDAAASALSEGITKLDAKSNPQSFVGVIDATGRVSKSYDIRAKEGNAETPSSASGGLPNEVAPTTP